MTRNEYIFEEVLPYAPSSEERSEEDEEQNQDEEEEKRQTLAWSSSLRMKTLVSGKWMTKIPGKLWAKGWKSH